MATYTAIYYNGFNNVAEVTSDYDDPEDFRNEIEGNPENTVMLIIEGEHKMWWSEASEDDKLVQILMTDAVSH